MAGLLATSEVPVVVLVRRSDLIPSEKFGVTFCHSPPACSAGVICKSSLNAFTGCEPVLVGLDQPRGIALDPLGYVRVPTLSKQCNAQDDTAGLAPLLSWPGSAMLSVSFS